MTSFWDKYSHLKSPIHLLNPKIKILLSFFFVLLLSILPLEILIWVSPIILTLLIIIIYLSKIPVLHIVKRSFLIIPIIIPVILINTIFREEMVIEISTLFLLRSFISILILILLISTTKFHTIISTLAKWHFPSIFLIILSFMYRYFFLLIDELEKMIRSVKLRSSETKKTVLFKSYTNIMGVLMIKSFDRAERVFQAMEMRGSEDNWKIK